MRPRKPKKVWVIVLPSKKWLGPYPTKSKATAVKKRLVKNGSAIPGISKARIVQRFDSR